jgi:hypothetical protein
MERVGPVPSGVDGAELRQGLGWPLWKANNNVAGGDASALRAYSCRLARACKYAISTDRL